MDELWLKRVRWIGYLAIPAAGGVTLFVVGLIGGMFTAGNASSAAIFLFVVAFLLMVPEAIWLNLVPFMHWAKRYRGRHSTLWLCLLVFETTGWFKLIYLFRHILPDWRGTGRYKSAPTYPPAPAEQIGA
ncbi:MAG: hypothetical protein WBD98_01185 [Acidobacteriaceae bacterium]|jgi:hypothetical protein